jgi:hypothetical protein
MTRARRYTLVIGGTVLAAATITAVTWPSGGHLAGRASLMDLAITGNSPAVHLPPAAGPAQAPLAQPGPAAGTTSGADVIRGFKAASAQHAHAIEVAEIAAAAHQAHAAHTRLLAQRAAAAKAAAARAAAARAAQARAAARAAQQAAAQQAAAQQAAAARAARPAAPGVGSPAGPSHPAAPPVMDAAPSGSPRQVAQQMLDAAGEGGQFSCLDSLWSRESGWNVYASNPGSGAYGIPQALPGSKMASAGADWRTDAATQIRWGLSYIGAAYGSPCAAWSHEEVHGWY